jgi:hypothetical protein
LVQAFLKKWWVESDFKAPKNLPKVGVGFPSAEQTSVIGVALSA